MASRTVSIVLTGTNASAVRAIEGVGVAAQKAGLVTEQRLGGAARKVGLSFNALAAQAGAFGVPFAATIGRVGTTFEQVEGKSQKFGSTIGQIGQVEAAAAAVGLVALGTESVHLADALEQAHARLTTAVKNVGQSYGDFKDRVEKTNAQMEKFGFTNADTESSIANLTNATHDTGKALELQGLAADVARGRHIDLATATTILMKVETGHVALLGRLGINVKDASGKIISQEEAIRRLSATYKGQAAAAADTFAGKMKTLSTIAEDLGAKLGESIVPKIEAVASASSKGVQGFEKINAAAAGIPGKVLAIAAAIPVAVFAAEKLASAGAKIGEQFSKVGRFVTTGTTAPAEAGASSAVVASNVAAAQSADRLAASNAAATASFVAMTPEELRAAAAAGELSAEELAVVLATQELNAALAQVASTADLDAIAIERLAAADEAAALAATRLAEARSAAAAAGAEKTAGVGAGAAVSGLGTGIVAIITAAIGGQIVTDFLNKLGDDAPKIDRLTAAANDFAKSGIFDTALAETFGTNADKIGKLLDDFEKAKDKRRKVQRGPLGAAIDIVTGQRGDENAAVKNFKAVDEELSGLVKTGNLSLAKKEFEFLTAAAVAQGHSIDDVRGALPRYGQAVDDAAAHAAAGAKTGTQAAFSLGAAFDQLSGKTSAIAKAEELGNIADKFSAVSDAQAKVAADKADIAGTSKNAQAADRAEADAVRGLRDANQAVSDSHQRLTDSYQSLQDAQDRVKTSAHSLLEAQQALDEFNSPRGARERVLQLDIIQRRVASSPIEQDQKQLDLLKLADENKNKQQSLTDAVASAQKSLVDANRGVAQAQRGIADAERGIADATQKVTDAQQNVSDAVAKRKAVHDDAAKAIGKDERDVQKAIGAVVDELKKAKDAHLLANTELGNYLTLLDDVAKVADPSGVLSKNLDSVVGKMQLTAVLAQKAIDDATKGSGPTSFGSGAAGPSPSPPGTGEGLSPADLLPAYAARAPEDQALSLPQWAHKYHIPGYAAGGTVAPDKTIMVGERGPELFVPKAGVSTSATGSPITIAASAALKGHTVPGPPSTTTPVVIGVDGPHIFVPPAAGTIVPNDKLAQTAAGTNPDLKGYAAGGTVEKDRPIVVGENGPEIFVPQSAGALVNVKQTAATSHAVSSATSATSTSTSAQSTSSSVVQNFSTQLPAAAGAVEKFSTVIGLAATKTDEAQKATAGYAKAQERYNTERSSRTRESSTDKATFRSTGGVSVVTNQVATFTNELSSSLKVFDAQLVKIKEVAPIRTAAPILPPSPLVANSERNHQVTFANTYHINAHDNPTKTELDAINREQSWRLTQSGRR